MNGHSYIAIATTQPIPKIEVTAPENPATPISIWGLAGAILLASIPHLWQWIGGHQQARNSLTEKLLQNLNDNYKLYSISNDAFRTMVENAAKKPTELAQDNAQRLRDLLQESAETRNQIINLTKRVESLATIVTRQAQNK
jgi:hypothetical protein